MKKLFYVVVYGMILFTEGWGWPLIFQDMKHIEKKKAEALLLAIKNKDKISFKKYFIPHIEHFSSHYDEDVDHLFERFQIQTYEVIDVMVYESALYQDGEGIVQWNVSMLIATDIGELRLMFVDVRKDYRHKENVGIRGLFLLEERKADEIDFDDFDLSTLPYGVYVESIK